MKISIITPSIRPAGLEITQKCLKEQTFQDFEWLTDIGLGNKHDLNQAFNRLIKRSKGELIVVLQDYIKIGPYGLEKFWEAYQKDKNTFYTAPVCKSKSLNFDGELACDWRMAAPGKIEWMRWEIDWGCCSREALFKIGGFDEELDKYWSCDNVNVACRAEIAGYKFFNLIENPSVAYDHDAFMKHPFREKFKPQFNQQRMRDFTAGLKIDYLN